MALPSSFLIRAPQVFRMMCSHQHIKTAGILVIGDEILKGEVIDTNSPIITKELHNLGVKVKKISFVGDEVDEISDEIRLFSKHYSYVITTGGIGPTHDDVTFEAVAKAFNVTLTLNSQLQKLCEKFYNTNDINHPGMKLAMVPETSKLTFSDDCNYPNVAVENVYMFPGIPELFQKSFNSLCDRLFKCEVKFYGKVIYVNVTEDKIADALNEAASEYNDVQIGSYPKLYKVKITIESMNKETVDEVYEKLLTKLPKDAVVLVNEEL